MELQTYLNILWRRKWLILLITVLVVGAAYAYTVLATPLYVSTTTLRVVTIGSELGGRPDRDYTELLMSTYASIATGGTVRSELMRELGLDARPTIAVDLVRNTELMKVQATAADPALAQSIADATAQIIIRESRQQFSGDGQSVLEILQRQVQQVESELATARQNYDQLAQQNANDSSALDAARKSIELKERTYSGLLDDYETARINEAVRANAIYVVEPANLPANPSSPRGDVNLVMGLMVGLFLGMALAFLVDNLDTRLYANEQIEAVAQAPIIGEIPRARDSLRIAYSGNGHTAQSEAFRRLRVNVLAPNISGNIQTLLVTSAKEGDGKSTVAGNLALTMAQSGRRVILVDCNIHQPSVHELFDLPNEAGLSNLLAGHASLSGVTQETKIPRLHIIASGTDLLLPMNGVHSIMPAGLVDRLSQGAELLGSPRMATILAELREAYDIVILDTPAVTEITDAMVLAPFVDEIVLVVARHQSTRDTLRTAQRQLSNIGVKSVGVVLN
ncbi:MAG: polysaccharide biosynthesis tyrosine autokinase [Caldilineaceae bacterium]|nr:polysaccharide biosynthesis tyrosine autokinase [Caldilineaceae bacterium]